MPCRVALHRSLPAGAADDRLLVLRRHRHATSAQAIAWMRASDPYTLITPGKIYRALGKSAECGGCIRLFVEKMRADDNLAVPVELRNLQGPARPARGGLTATGLHCGTRPPRLGWPRRAFGLRPDRGGVSHEGRQWGSRLPEQGAAQRAHRDQPVLAALPSAGRLGLRPAGREVAQGEHRGDAPRRQADGPHHLPRGPSEPADPRSAPDRREPARDPRLRPRRRIRRPHALCRGPRPLREGRRLRLQEPVRGADARTRRATSTTSRPRSTSSSASARRTGASSTPSRPTSWSSRVR